ncbi:Type I restriction-modification system, restriction subunit R [Serinicoccus hydrothermalis]|uniref:Type I restriction enzyme endonuclease subunit n=1 Tax=Serinicoccus hydrothermalis TaxID=1758689 RepID=A0A1B1NFR5_9MICO|nr:type I restriction endonuclease subunit R [Serinicoccus hydrothermalis]ANS80273.1 Type I restriction-modification system, restriction subunit R [Serinicoccus hydrothermalis]
MGHEMGFNEDAWEQVALETLAEYEWKPLSGVDIAPGSGERQTWDDPVIQPRLQQALARLNPDVPTQHLQQAMADLLAPKSQDAITENHRIHGYLVHGYRGISYVDTDGSEQNPTIRLVSHDPAQNDYLAVNQVTVRVGDHQRRFDVVLYLNGLPVAIVELKKGGNHRVGVANAHAQLETYLRELPMAFRFCVLTVASDGVAARYGTPFTPLNHFSPWNVDDEGQPVRPEEGKEGYLSTGIEQLIAGIFNVERFGHLLRDFTAFDNDSDTGLAKRIAKPHQYFAVTKAVGSTIDAVRSNGKAGVVWHTQGSGKSMEMELYTAKVLTHPALLNPTVVVITDRKELDGQLFEGFKRSDLLPEEPVTIKTRTQLRDELTSRVTGGVLFTTLQKFGRSQAERESGIDHPLLSDRRNVIVIVDEAHRSHYDDLDGYARHLKDALPNATLIAFTGTPVSFEDRNTRDVFGDYIDVYDLSRAVADEATVPVLFEARLIQMGLADQVSEEDIDRAADEASTGVDLAERERLEKSVAVINAVYGAPARLQALAADIVTHWEQRRDQMAQFIEAPGKSMVVGATRHICAALYDEIIALRPDWHSDDLEKGIIKVVYSGDAQDPEHIARHVRRESENATIKERLRQVDDELQIVIVKDMMLTGYDSQPLHTLYLDRPLKGALLMQTLARVNRTFRGKQDGLLVAYAPLAENLNKALAEYSAEDQSGRPMGRDIDEAAALSETLVAQLRELCAGYAWRDKIDPTVRRSWMDAALGLANHLRSPHTPGNDVPEGEQTLADRYRALSGQLARAWAVSSGSQALEHLRGDILFFQETRVYMAKMDAEARQAAGEPIPEEIQRLLSDIVAASTATGEIVDIYEAAGIPRPSLADLDQSFVAQVQQAEHPHLAIEALRAMLTAESTRVSRHNLVRQRAFSERITELMNRYTNQQLTSAEVIAELIALAKEVAAEADRGQTFDPALSEDELAFYDAVAQNESAVELMGDDVLAAIARELLGVMQRDVKTDWTVRDDVRAKLRSSIKRLLVLHRYPPDRQLEAIRLVIDQMEAMAPRYAERKAS